MTFNTISIVGLGYIGLPTAAVFASKKMKVVGVDVNPDVVETINRGEIHIVEPDLDMLVQNAVNSGYLKATLLPESADAFLIAVPTPFKNVNHEPDLCFIESACKAIAPQLKRGDLIILESTSPVGATEKVASWMAETRPDLSFPNQNGEDSDIRIAYCPERVLPGQILKELVQNDRIIGGMTSKCSKAAAKLYEIFVKGECVLTDSRTAEMVKLTENSFRDVNIAFANELSLLCGKLNIDVTKLIALANLHPRVNVLHPGPGVGGHCISVDPWFLIHSAPQLAKLMTAARSVNDSKPAWVVEKILQVQKQHNIQHVICMGLTYKPDVDDFRESPALEIYESLKFHAKEFSVSAVEPYMSKMHRLSEGSNLIDIDSLPKNNSLIVGLVSHTVFQSLDLGENVLIDFANVWNR
jgi:UDP-N-acetyl-D-mannosaminuronic acid dehydrogenase